MKNELNVRCLKTAVRAALAMLALAPVAPSIAQEDDVDAAKMTAAPAPVRKVALQSLLSGTVAIDFSSAKALYNETILRDGNIAAMMQKLGDQSKDSAKTARYRANALLVAGHLQWNYGQPKEALESVEASLKTELTADALLMKAFLLDAAGDVDDARECYQQVMPMLKDSARKEKVQLRLTFIDVGRKNVQSLVDFAKAHDAEFRNRAAVALAILNYPKEAANLYAPLEKGSEALREHLRLAQWAIRAGDARKAQEHAWAAVQVATLSRDKRYSLSVAIDAYQMDDSLDKLLQRLAQKKTLTEDEQTVRIEILRQLKRYDEAVKLFQTANTLQLSPQAQTYLLRMYRDAGRSKEMIAEYKKLIARDPKESVWAEGLSRYLLEQNERAAAKAVWSDFIARNDEAPVLLAAAKRMIQFGFDDLAVDASEKCIQVDPESATAALMFRFELNRRRGDVAAAEAVLTRLKTLLPQDSMTRVEIANGYTRLERPKESLAVLEELLKSRGGDLGIDEKMRMAWLYDSLGQRDKALDVWKSLWNGNISPVRRRLVEDRMLMLAVQTGTVGRMAIELERKLAKGTATERDSSLLIRLYTDAHDTGSAIEVIQENFTRQGQKDSIESLKEQAKVYRALGRYSAFEKITERLLVLDPKDAVDNIQSLILNHLDNPRGSIEEKKEKLGKWLAQLRETSGAAAGAEFEAGVLDLGGFSGKSMEVYRRALAQNPAHGDNYLLLADALKKQSRQAEAIASLQYAVENEERDDVFIVAIDGILNMEPQDSGLMRWLQRRVLERLTAHNDKLYLYDLLSEIAQADKDTATYLSALENSLAYANSRRSTVLRELTSATNDKSRGRMAEITGQFNQADLRLNLEYSRRLIALGEEMPPDVYLDMGKTFLKIGDVANASDAFNMALDRTGRGALVEETGDLFKRYGYNQQAMNQYERALISDADNIGVMFKLGGARDLAGFGEEANGMYLKTLAAMVAGQNIKIETSAGKDLPPLEDSLSYDYKNYFWPLLAAFLRTLPEKPLADGPLPEEWAAIDNLFKKTLEETVGSSGVPSGAMLAGYPRLAFISHFARLAALRAGYSEMADKWDGLLLAHFSNDRLFVSELVELRLNWGLRSSAAQLLAQAKASASSETAKDLPLIPLDAKSGLAKVAPSADLIREAMTDKQYEKAVTLALFMSDAEQALSAYREWTKEGLATPIPASGYVGDSARAVIRPVVHARNKLDARHYGELCRYVFDLAADKPEYAKRLMIASLFNENSAVNSSAETSLLLDMEKAAGREFVAKNKIFELAASVGNRLRDYVDLTYVVTRLTGEQQVDALLHYLTAENDRPVNWLKVFSALQIVLTEPLSAQSEKRLCDTFKEVVRKTIAEKMAEQSAISEQAKKIADWSNLEFTRGIAPANIAILQKLEDQLVANHPNVLKPGLFKVSISMSTGKVQEALPLVVENALSKYEYFYTVDAKFMQIMGQDRAKMADEAARDYLATFAGYLYPQYAEALLKLAEAKQSGELTEALFAVQLRIVKADPRTDAAALTKWLEAKEARYPKNEFVLNALQNAYAQNNALDKEVAVLERLVELAPRNMQYRWRLFSLWQELGNPERALTAAAGRLADVLQVEKAEQRKVEDRMLMNGMRTYEYSQLPFTTKNLLDQVVAVDSGGSVAQAKSALRGVWQTMPAPITEGFGLVKPRNGFEASIYRSLRLFHWGPAPAPENMLKERGGAVPDAVDRLIEISSNDPVNRRAVDGSGNFLTALAQREFSIAELEALIRSFEPRDIDWQYPLYGLLADAYEHNKRAPAEFARLTKTVSAGRADIKTFVLWLELALRQPQSELANVLSAAEKQVLESGGICQYQQVLLARLYAKAAQEGPAADMYVTAVLNAMKDRRFGMTESSDLGTERFNRVPDLYRDARLHLSDAGMNRFVEQMLKIIKLGMPESKKTSRMYMRFVIGTLESHGNGPDSMRRELESLLDLDAKKPLLNRLDVFRVARMQMRWGQLDQALKTVRTALQRPNKNPDEERGGYDYMAHVFSGVHQLEGGGEWLYSNEAGDVTDFLARFRGLMPLDSKTDGNVREWSVRLAAAVPEWTQQNVLELEQAVQLLSMIAIRQQRLGFADDAKVTARILSPMLAQTGKTSMPTTTLALFAVDRVGGVIEAPVLQAMIEAKRIDTAYLVPLMRRISETEGADKALTVGELAAGYSREESLLQELRTLCSQMNDVAKAQQWGEIEQSAVAARGRIERGEDFETKKPGPVNSGIGASLDIKFTAVDGREVDLAKMKGKVVLIDFWATWCGPCLKEIPNIKAVYDKYHSQGFEVVGIALEETANKDRLIEYCKTKELGWPQHFDGKGWENEFATKYGIKGIPSLYLLDKNGKVAGKKGGADLEYQVRRLLGLQN